MSSVMALLILFSLVSFIICTIAALFFAIKKKNYWKHCIAGTFLSVVLFLALFIMSPSPPIEAGKESAITDHVPEVSTTTYDNSKSSNLDSSISLPVEPTYNIGFTSDQFVTKFNAAAKKSDLDLEVQHLQTVEKETYREMQCEITDNIIISGSINKSDNTVRNLIMFARGDGTSQSGFQILGCMLNLINVVSPELPPKECGALLKALNVSPDIPDQSTTEATRGNIRYGFGISREVGILFSATNANDEK